MPYFIATTTIKNDAEVYIKLEGIDSKETARKLTPKEVWITEEDFKKFAAKAAPISMPGFHLINEEEERPWGNCRSNRTTTPDIMCNFIRWQRSTDTHTRRIA